MFADDSNLFKVDKNLDRLFLEMNKELENVSIWFKANKLSLNVKKTKFSLFHQSRKKKLIPEFLPKLCIDNCEIQRELVTKFLGVYIDENLTWKHHINNVKTKVSKSIGILYRSRDMLNKPLLKQLYHSFVHSYLNYGNVAWASTNKTTLDPLYRKQKHAIRVINLKDRFEHSKPLFTEMKILTLFKQNIFNFLVFVFKCKLKESPRIFHGIFTLKPPNK